MIVDILVALVVLSATFLQRGERRFCAMIFAWLTFGHWALASDLDGWLYYIVSALFDFLIMIILSAGRTIPWLAIQLQKICFAFIVVNIFGFFLWLAYLPPLAYNVICIMIYIFTLIILLKKDGENVGGGSMDSWFPWYRRHVGAGMVHHDSHKGKV